MGHNYCADLTDRQLLKTFDLSRRVFYLLFIMIIKIKHAIRIKIVSYRLSKVLNFIKEQWKYF